MYNHQLDTFIVAADCGSFAKAGQRLFVSPNAVMKQIDRLEEQLGITLFLRTNRGLALTDAGKLIYRDAKQMIANSHKTLERARTLGTKDYSVVRVGSSLMCPGQMVIALRREIGALCSDIRLQIVPFEDNFTRFLDHIERLGQSMDLFCGLFPSGRYAGRCNILDLGWQKLRVAAPMDHRLANRKKLTISDLYGERLIMVYRGDTSYVDMLRDEMEQHHPKIEIIDVPGYDVDTMNHCEREGCLMITADIWVGVHPSLVTLPVDWDFAVPYGLIYAKKPSEPVRRFIDAVRTTRGIEN